MDQRMVTNLIGVAMHVIDCQAEGVQVPTKAPADPEEVGKNHKAACLGTNSSDRVW